MYCLFRAQNNFNYINYFAGKFDIIIIRSNYVFLRKINSSDCFKYVQPWVDNNIF